MHLAPLAGVRARWACLGDADREYAIDWSPTRDYAANTVHNFSVDPDAQVAPAVTIATLDFALPVTVDHLRGQAEWNIAGGTEVDGLAYWFDLHLGAGVTLSNAPGASPASWGHCILPIDPPIRFTEPGLLSATAGPEWVNGEPGWFRWTAVAGQAERGGHEFRSFPASTVDLVGISPDSVPHLNRNGYAATRALGLVDGTRSISAIARRLREDFDPALDQREAERLVGSILIGKIADGRLPERHP
jgi:hypothetical protein